MRLPLDPGAAHRAVAGRDARWDGRIYLGVVTTGIYCRPSCPARTPRPENCRYFPTAAAAVAAGFRACRRCRPDILPGSRGWDTRADLTARAVRLIADGALDDGSVAELAARLAVSVRQLHRLLVTEVGASPQQLGRTRRAHTARTLIEQTSLPLSDIAFAAGFGSIRQFNDVMRQEFGAAPGTFPRPSNRPRPEEADGRTSAEAPTLTLHLAYRPPLALGVLAATLAAHAIPGVEDVEGPVHERILDAPGGPAVARLDLSGAGERASGAAHPSLPVRLQVSRLPDLMPVVVALRRWLDLDADPEQVTAHLAVDGVLGPLVAARPGLRVPGAVDGAELAVCAVLGQQVSVRVARTLQGRLAMALGRSLGSAAAAGGVERVVFPRPETLAEAGPQRIRDAANLTQARAHAVHALAEALAGGLTLAPGTDAASARHALLALPGIGPWTADYIAVRALHDPDAFMAGDLVARRALAAAFGVETRRLRPADAERLSQPWRPWRSYALQHLWTQEVYA
ncbi:Ada metal-binding domain-containing protein [Propionicicella superfundia]|uniref:Ada metal-binding domain-containing protein n=1 Tax=Propionicicella superfundia TaxID=348582 RepID=UPI00048C4782|nr:Ada metal-binding domain-containing protein [Propionicicella superfundia]